jgi:hypothetical protein
MLQRLRCVKVQRWQRFSSKSVDTTALDRDHKLRENVKNLGGMLGSIIKQQNEVYHITF